jgi:hypothetical protein
MVYTVVIYFDNFGRFLKPYWRINEHGCRANFCVHFKTKWRANAPGAALIFVFISNKMADKIHMVAALIFVHLKTKWRTTGQMHLLPH